MFKSYIRYLKDNPKRYWFKRKLFGWGWTPATWEGWLITLIVLGLIIVNAIRADYNATSEKDVVLSVIPQTFILILLLIAVCYVKGEKPKWQWGIPKNKDKQ